MTTQATRAALIGLDGVNYEAMKPLLEQGMLPNLAGLLRNGTLCQNAYAPYPTLTGSNWASIATGAWPGTHGVSDMWYHVTGEPADNWRSAITPGP
jgi:predicted AlkP superfamily phosphohydrolase/phosphomutase